MRKATEQAPRNVALLNNLNEQAAERKTISVVFLSLGTADRKSVTDKVSEMKVATVTLQELRTNCDKEFCKPRNRTLGQCAKSQNLTTSEVVAELNNKAE